MLDPRGVAGVEIALSDRDDDGDEDEDGPSSEEDVVEEEQEPDEKQRMDSVLTVLEQSSRVTFASIALVERYYGVDSPDGLGGFAPGIPFFAGRRGSLRVPADGRQLEPPSELRFRPTLERTVVEYEVAYGHELAHLILPGDAAGASATLSAAGDAVTGSSAGSAHVRAGALKGKVSPPAVCGLARSYEFPTHVLPLPPPDYCPASSER